MTFPKNYTIKTNKKGYQEINRFLRKNGFIRDENPNYLIKGSSVIEIAPSENLLKLVCVDDPTKELLENIARGGNIEEN